MLLEINESRTTNALLLQGARQSAVKAGAQQPRLFVEQKAQLPLD